MATKDQRYTVEIFMVNHQKGEPSNYLWRNVNTGLFKVVKNLNDLHGDKWDYFIARRKSNKEIVDTVYNHITKNISAVRLYLKYRPNSKNNGIIAQFIYKRGEYELMRGIPLAESILLEKYSDYFSIPAYMYQKIVLNGKKALYEYYLKNGHQIVEDEIKLGTFPVENFNFKIERLGTSPLQDYP